MKIVALLFVVGMASAGRLNSYLPPIPGVTSVGTGLIQPPGSFNAQVQSGAAGGSYQGYTGHRGQAIAITRYDNQNIGDGTYRYNYETANGISAEETGVARGESQSASGFYSYTGTDGLKYTVHYTADENGFHPEGAHLPTPPPIPEEIKRGVELSLAAEARGENQGGSHRFGSQSTQVYDNGGINANGGYHY